MMKKKRWRNLGDLEAASKALSKRWQRGKTGNWAEDLRGFLRKKVRVNKTGCWIWLGSMDVNGYGRLNYAWGSILAHRASYLLFHGDLPEGKPCVCHACDTPRCISPKHLWAGSQRDNIRDAVKKGRVAQNFKGEGNNRAVLKDEDILKIRAAKKLALKSGKKDWGATKIAKELGVSKSHVSEIAKGRHWEHLK